MKLEYLKQYITITKKGTLTKAAEHLHISQSTLTRNMYSLERMLKVKLFHRTPNHIELTETGQYALPRFQKILEQHYQMIDDIKAFDNKETIIKGGVCAQGPAWKIKKLHESLELSSKLNVNLLDENDLIKAIKDSELDFIVTSFPIQIDGIESRFYFQEQLYLSVPKEHELYHRTNITFSDLQGQTLLVRTQLGIWQEVIDSLNQINFIFQERDTFEQLVGQFSLPAFTTNISQRYNLGDIRKNIIITDENSRMDYYIS